MDDMIGDFILETQEGLNNLDNFLIDFEKDPSDKQLLDKIFRVMHTIKGGCGFLGLERLQKLAHTAETLMDIFRDGKRVAQPEEVAAILMTLDRIRELLIALEMAGKEPEGDDSDLIELLEVAIQAPEAPQDLSQKEANTLLDDMSSEKPKTKKTSKTASKAAPKTKKTVSKKQEAAEAEETAVNDFLKTAPEQDDSEKAVKKPAPEPKEVAQTALKKAAEKASVAPQGAENAELGERAESEKANQVLRVPVSTIENMLNMVSELVLTRNQLVQQCKDIADGDVHVALRRLNTVVYELQDNVMKTRMQPIGNAWLKLPRIVHDIARKEGKKIDLHMIGEEAEMDRQVLEFIRDPLVHMIRNSADHGIEMPEDRRAAGKSETGHITLTASHEGGYIIIGIADDGRGLNAEKIRKSIVEKGLIAQEQAHSLSDKQVYDYIFAPGFSTASEVTSVSGRGVGMDVVRTNIEKIGGSIELNSTPGKGTTFMIRIPLTLAIVSALIVTVEQQLYALPQLNVQELVRVSPRHDNKIEQISGRKVLRFRGHLLPLVSLHDMLESKVQGNPDHDCYVVVVHLGGVKFGLIVDDVHDTQEIVVKAVSPVLQKVGIYAGNTILGDGRVIMILDPSGIAKVAGILSLQQPEEMVEEGSASSADEDTSSVLVFKAGDSTPKAVPAFLISRIEVFDSAKVEYTNDKPMIQYRNGLLELHSFKTLPKEGLIQALIFSDDRFNSTFGVVIDEVSDIVTSALDIKASNEIAGFLGAAIINGHATQVLDVNHFTGNSDWRAGKQSFAPQTNEKQLHILIVEDSAFFRHMLYPLLRMAGYGVTLCENPQKALALLEKNTAFDLILSDIEMGEMDGFAFAEEVQKNEKIKHIPMVALSARTERGMLEKARRSGFKSYLSKSNRNALLDEIRNVLMQGNLEEEYRTAAAALE